MAAGAAKLETTSFRGDFDRLSTMMQRAWATNKETPLLYTAGFLRSALAYPGVDFRLSPSVYCDDQPLAFVAGLPRRFQLNGAEQNFLLTSFLTAGVDQQGSSYGLSLWRNVHERAREAGYAGGLSLCVEGDQMNKIIASVARLFRFHTQHVFTVDYMTRFLRPAQEGAPAASDRDLNLFLELTSRIPGPAVPFARLWTRDEAEWQCRLRSGALSVSAYHDEHRGMLTGYTADVASNPAVKALAVEDVLWGDLGITERKDLLQRFLRAAAAQGAQMASCPVMNYADLEPFRAAGFRASKRRVHVYLTDWGKEPVAALPAIYMDIL
jgi:hypothetical protein